MLIYNNDTVLLRAEIRGDNGDDSYVLIQEYGINGVNFITKKHVLRKMMQTNSYEPRYPGMKVDVCNYTYTSDNRLVPAGERKFNEYRKEAEKNPDILFDTNSGNVACNDALCNNLQRVMQRQQEREEKRRLRREKSRADAEKVAHKYKKYLIKDVLIVNESTDKQLKDMKEAFAKDDLEMFGKPLDGALKDVDALDHVAEQIRDKENQIKIKKTA